MKLKLWGTRGSIPSPGPSTIKYGGNTACIQIEGSNKECIILDAGTGIRPLGIELMEKYKPLPVMHLLVSHTHWDHIQGFPFFGPCYIPDTKIEIKGPVHFLEEKTLQSTFDVQMQYEFFPVSNEQLKADITYEPLDETEFDIGNIHVKSLFSNHPIRSLMYHLTEKGKSIVYTGDHEPYYNLFAVEKESPADDADDIFFDDTDTNVAHANGRFVNFIKGVDLLVMDCQYAPEEYKSLRRGYGHSSWDYCLDWMKEAGVKKMVLTHHDPARTDEEIDKISDDIRGAAVKKGIDPENILMAKEGMEIKI